MTSGSARLFIAAEVPEAYKSAYASTLPELERLLPRARWPRPTGIHLTFKFLGSTPQERLGAIGEAVSSVARRTAPFGLVTGQPGFFGGRSRARVLWMALEGDVEAAVLLAKGLEGAMGTLGFAPEEDRPFRPHLTVARLRPERRTRVPDDLMACAAERLAGIRVPVDHIIVFESILGSGVLGSGGSRYIARDQYTLEGRPP